MIGLIPIWPRAQSAGRSADTSRAAWKRVLSSIKLLILDVDGVMTTGALAYCAAGNEEKTFYVQDGGAIGLWRKTGGSVAIISGRKAEAVEARGKDLGITTIVQGVLDKMPVYETICRQAGVADDEVSFVGDALLDIGPMRRCGYPIAVANALPRVKRVARYVTRRAGGEGAVAEAVERLLRHNGTWAEALTRRQV